MSAANATLLDLWKESTRDTIWSNLNLERELANCEGRALRPRIPDDHLIFRIFRSNQPIKVVLLGQDPYPEVLNVPVDEDNTMIVSRACGYSFSSPFGRLPLSLRTIFNEILREYPQEGGETKASEYSGDLSYLVENGVFLLNTYLTVSFDGNRGVPLSHQSWISFTTQILNFIHRTYPNAVYLALGKKAADLLKASGINDAIECDHPANRFGGRNPFNGSDIFLKADALLDKRGITKIDWIPKKEPVDIKYYMIEPSPKVSSAPEVEQDEESD